MLKIQLVNYRGRSTKLKVKTRKRKLYSNKKLNSWKEPFKTTRRRKMNTQLNLSERRKTTNSGFEKCNRSMNSKSKT